jgi:alginate O-acetyltransferase complex protein AlgI
MLFNSIDFALFLPVVFAVYWIIGKNRIKMQNIFLLISSYFFYGWWDYRFLLLIVISSIIDYYAGLQIFKSETHKRRLAFLLLSLFANLGFLGFFKYYNFFIDSFIDTFSFFGYAFQANRLNIILPVGISFYTFQTLSYSIDIYNRKLKPTKNFIAFFSFVSFFPQLVAGPIERARNLLPQFLVKRDFSYRIAMTGLLDIAWGLFKKMVVADNLAIYVNIVYGDVGYYSGFPLLWATVFFSFQIYCDFSGYSSIAIGVAKLFGFSLMKNFKRPYFASSFQDFWGRWHISLSSWFRDYVYIPLGGNQKSKKRTNTNIMITFIISGLWHGANWTFMFWGAIHGLFNIISKFKIGFKIPLILRVVIVFVFTNFAWIFFRAESISDAFHVICNILPLSTSSFIGIPTITKEVFVKMLLLIMTLLFIDFLIERKMGKGASNDSYPKNIKITIYTTLLLLGVYTMGIFEYQEFIYFQF